MRRSGWRATSFRTCSRLCDHQRDVTFAVVGGLRGGAYSAPKGGLTALTTHIACQYGAQGIRCNAVAPGVTLTPMVAERLEDERFQDQHRDDATHLAGRH